MKKITMSISTAIIVGMAAQAVWGVIYDVVSKKIDKKVHKESIENSELEMAKRELDTATISRRNAEKAFDKASKRTDGMHPFEVTELEKFRERESAAYAKYCEAYDKLYSLVGKQWFYSDI